MTEEQIISAISQKYANALTETAIELGGPDYFAQQLKEISKVITSSNDLQLVMSNSSISVSKKIEIINEIFSSKIDTKLLNFLKTITEKNRFDEFASIKYAYEKNIEKYSNKKTVEITSPIALNFENKSNILFKLEHKLNCEVKPVWKVDESLIAGLTFKFDDCVIDTSIRTKLENLSKGITRG
ncbi:MAG: ATP synthase F1 subunit delta [Candidatus Gastranaerophilaceae bacterium]